MAAERLTLETAESYIAKIKTIFNNPESPFFEPNVKTIFEGIMKEFQKERIKAYDVAVQVSQLFNGHSDLILGFNIFLPQGYKLEVIKVMMTVTGQKCMQTILNKPDRTVEMTALQPLDSFYPA